MAAKSLEMRWRRALPGAAPLGTLIGAGQRGARILAHRFDIALNHRSCAVVVADDGGLELWLDRCLRKRRAPSGREPLYAWTNVELDWEEHRYVEARYHQARRELTVAIDGEPALKRRLPAAAAPPAAGPACP